MDTKRIVNVLRSLEGVGNTSRRQVAAAALEYAKEVLLSDVSDLVNQHDVIVKETAHQEPEVTAYDGSLRLCIDFGTAVSKAFAWDRKNNEPKPLKIGSAAGEPGSPYTLNSTIFIAHDGLVYFGQQAIGRATAVDPQKHRAFQSIKDVLSVYPMTDLQEPILDLYNPTENPINYREIIILYLAFLTDNALVALRDDHQELNRNVPLTYAKPVFDKSRDQWATRMLNEAAAVGKVLADRFSESWGDGIPLTTLTEAIANARSRENVVLVEKTTPEPIAAFAPRARYYDSAQSQRRLMMVVDVGAGTTDFAMFAEIEREGEMRLFPIPDSVGTIRIAGDSIDSALIDYLLRSVEIAEGDSRIAAIRADMQQEIRLIKEELFERGEVRRRLVNDLIAYAEREAFLADPLMVRLEGELKRKFNEVLSAVHESWLSLGELFVFFTGGGASLPTVTKLARRQPIFVGRTQITASPVNQPPPWIQEECEVLTDLFQQLAVCIGGALLSAGEVKLEWNESYGQFAGDLPDAHWKPDVVRKGE